MNKILIVIFQILMAPAILVHLETFITKIVLIIHHIYHSLLAVMIH